LWFSVANLILNAICSQNLSNFVPGKPILRDNNKNQPKQSIEHCMANQLTESLEEAYSKQDSPNLSTGLANHCTGF